MQRTIGWAEQNKTDSHYESSRSFDGQMQTERKPTGNAALVFSRLDHRGEPYPVKRREGKLRCIQPPRAPACCIAPSGRPG